MKKRVLLCVLLAVVSVVSVVVIHHLGQNLLDSDTSGEMLLSKCLFDEKSLVCPDWDYTIEYRINNQLIFAFLFGIFSDWFTVRFVGTLIILLIYVLTFIFFMRSCAFKTDTILFGCILVLLPYCVAYGRIVLYYSFYAPYLSFVFLIIGCFFHLLDGGGKWWMAGLVLFSFFGCVNGFRQFYITMIPMCALGLWVLIRTHRKKTLLLSLIAAAAGLIGLLFHDYVVMSNIHFEVEMADKLHFKGMSEVYVILFTIMRHFGYRSMSNKLSFLGIMSLAGIGVMGYVLFIAIKAFFVEKEEKTLYLRSMIFVQLVMTAVTMAFYWLPFNTRYDYSRYFVPASFWMIPLFLSVLEEKKSRIQQVLYAVVMAVFIGNSVINICFFLDPNHFRQDYDGLGYTTTDYITRYDEVLQFIKDEGYEMGYAFREANVISEKLNGVPVIAIEKNGDKIFYSDWLTRKSFRDTPAEKVFLWAYYDEAMTFLATPAAENSELVYNFRNTLLLFRLNDPEAFKAFLIKNTP